MSGYSNEKYKAFKEALKDKEKFLTSKTSFLLEQLTPLVEDFRTEVENNKALRSLTKKDFEEYKRDMYRFMFTQLGELLDSLRPPTNIVVTPEGKLAGIENGSPSEKELAPDDVLLVKNSYPSLRILDLELLRHMNQDQADNLISEEVRALEELIKQIEMEIMNTKDPGGKDSSDNLPKLKWTGDQKQLAELILTLEKHGWVETIQDGNRVGVCKNICNLFDISGTKKNDESNEVKSFTEIMKADTDKATKTRSYPKVFTSRYKKQFANLGKKEDE